MLISSILDLTFDDSSFSYILPQHPLPLIALTLLPDARNYNGYFRAQCPKFGHSIIKCPILAHFFQQTPERFPNRYPAYIYKKSLARYTREKEKRYTLLKWLHRFSTDWRQILHRRSLPQRFSIAKRLHQSWVCKSLWDCSPKGFPRYSSYSFRTSGFSWEKRIGRFSSS